MKEFDLPLLADSESIASAFHKMIHGKVSGIAAQSEDGRVLLLHYGNVLTAWKNGLQTIREIPDPIRLHKAVRGFVDSATDFALLEVSADRAYIFSSSEAGADFYSSPSPGYSCSQTPPLHHFYPPLRRKGSSQHCVVSGCSGTLR